MQKRTCELIVEAADDAGLDVKLYENYSGRCMYGAKTCGVVGPLTDFVQAVAIACTNSEETETLDWTREDFIDDLGRLRHDDMGRELIFY